MTKTALAEAFGRAGIPSAREAALRTARAAGEEAGGDIERAVSALLAQHDRYGFWAAVIGSKAIDDYLRRFLREAVQPIMETTNSTSGHAAGAADGTGQDPRVTHAAPARPSAHNSKPAVSLAVLERSRLTTAQSILDTLRLNGVPIGDVTGEQARSYADHLRGRARNDNRTAKLVEMLSAGVPPTGKIRDFITTDEAKKRAALAEAADNA